MAFDSFVLTVERAHSFGAEEEFVLHKQRDSVDAGNLPPPPLPGDPDYEAYQAHLRYEQEVYQQHHIQEETDEQVTRELEAVEDSQVHIIDQSEESDEDEPHEPSLILRRPSEEQMLIDNEETIQPTTTPLMVDTASEPTNSTLPRTPTASAKSPRTRESMLLNNSNVRIMMQGALFTRYEVDFESGVAGTNVKSKIYAFYTPTGGELGRVYWNPFHDNIDAYTNMIHNRTSTQNHTAFQQYNTINDASQFLNVDELSDIYVGKQPAVFEAEEADDNRCFSLVSGNLVLNLETQPEEVDLVNSWLSGLQYALESAGSSIVLAETNHEETSPSVTPIVDDQPSHGIGNITNGTSLTTTSGNIGAGVVAQAMASMAQATESKRKVKRRKSVRLTVLTNPNSGLEDDDDSGSDNDHEQLDSKTATPSTRSMRGVSLSSKNMSSTTPTKKLKEGFLVKMGGIRTNWKTRYFRINGEHLDYFKYRLHAPQPFKKVGSIPLASSQLTIIGPEIYGKPNLFGISPFLSSRTYILQASNENERREWLNDLEPLCKTDGDEPKKLTPRKDGSNEHKLDPKRSTTTPSLYEAPVLKEGILMKQGGLHKSWNKRYFKLRGGIIEYYSMNQEQTSPIKLLGTIALGGGDVSSLRSDGTRKYLFCLTPAQGQRNYILEASNDQERKDWMGAIQECLEVKNKRDPVSIWEGYLSKLGGALSTTWQERYFVLTRNSIKYYKLKTDAKPAGEIALQRGTLVEMESIQAYRKDFTFSITTLPGIGGTKNKSRKYILMARSDSERNKWMSKIDNVVTGFESEHSTSRFR